MGNLLAVDTNQRRFTNIMMIQTVLDILKIPDSNKIISQLLERYVQELELCNNSFDLIGAKNKTQIIAHHIFDSLNALTHIKQKATELQKKENRLINIADVGSGAGLPGIPLAICMSDFQFFLIERMSKRCIFLENCIALLGLQNVTVINAEIETITRDFDLITFRAFRPLNKNIIKKLFAMLSPNGLLVAYKAKKQSITEEMGAIKEIVPHYYTLALKTDALDSQATKYERNLVIIPQQQQADDKFLS
ncbi:MAG: 16S rRNA (guanine(527)-N(7))-methyltransferase RsmG [Treponemataceae bacterium]